MSAIELLVITFDEKQSAGQVLAELKAMDRKETLNILNAVALRKDANGQVTATDDGDLHAGGGALFGALVGAMIGLLGGPGGAVVGAAAGAITGGVTAAGMDLGFSNETIEALQDSLAPNESGILALVEPEWVDLFSSEVRTRGGRVVHSVLREEFTQRLHKERNED